MYCRAYILLLLILLSIANVKAAQSPEQTRLVDEGISFHNNGNYVQSIRSFQRALEIDPSNSEVRENLSIVHNNFGKYLVERTDGLGATREFRNALYYDPTNDIARNNLNVKLEELNYSATDAARRIEQAKQEKQKSNFFAAIAEARESIQIKKTAAAYVEIGEVYQILYLKSGKKVNYINDAIESLEIAKALEPNSIDPLIKLGEAYISKNEISKGIDYFKEAVELDTSSEKAKVALVNGWLAALRIAPQIPSNHVGLATAYQLLGKFDLAETGYKRALEIDPQNKLAQEGLSSLRADRISSQVSIYLNRALEFQGQKKYESSLAEYIKALNLDPKNADIHYNIGTAFQAKGDAKRARKAYNRTIELKFDHKDAKIALENLEKKQQIEAITKGFDHAIRLQRDGKNEEAIQVYLAIQKDKPEDDTLYYNLGTAYQAINDFDKAIENYQQAYELNEEDNYYKAIVNAKVEKANKLLEEGIEQQSRGWNGLAIKKYDAVLKLFPDNANAWYNLGTAYQSIEKSEKALEAYQKAYGLDESNQSDAIFFAALILEEKRKLNEAISLYEKYVEVAPKGNYAQDSRDRQTYIKSFI